MLKEKQYINMVQSEQDSNSGSVSDVATSHKANNQSKRPVPKPRNSLKRARLEELQADDFALNLDDMSSAASLQVTKSGLDMTSLPNLYYGHTVSVMHFLENLYSAVYLELTAIPIRQIEAIINSELTRKMSTMEGGDVVLNNFIDASDELINVIHRVPLSGKGNPMDIENKYEKFAPVRRMVRSKGESKHIMSKSEYTGLVAQNTESLNRHAYHNSEAITRKRSERNDRVFDLSLLNSRINSAYEKYLTAFADMVLFARSRSLHGERKVPVKGVSEAVQILVNAGVKGYFPHSDSTDSVFGDLRDLPNVYKRRIYLNSSRSLRDLMEMIYQQKGDIYKSFNDYPNVYTS